MDQTKEGDDAPKTAQKHEDTPDTTSTFQPDPAQVEQPPEAQPAQTTQSQEDTVAESQSGQDTTSRDVVTKAAGEDVVVSGTADQTHSEQRKPEEDGDKKSEEINKGSEEERVEEQPEKQEDSLEGRSGRDQSEDPSVRTTDSTEAPDNPSNDQENPVAGQPEQDPQDTNAEAQADSPPTQPQEPEATQLSAEAPNTAESSPPDQPLEPDSSTVEAEDSSTSPAPVPVSAESSAEPEAVAQNSELPQDTAAERREEEEVTAAEADHSVAHEDDLKQEDTLETPAQEDASEIKEDSVDKQEDSSPVPEPSSDFPEPKEEIKEDRVVSEAVSENANLPEKPDSEQEATLVKGEVSGEDVAVTEPCPSSPKPSEQKEGGDSEEQATPDPAPEDSKVEPEAEQNLPEEPSAVTKPESETPRESEPEHTADAEEVSDLQEKSAQIVEESIANAVKVVSEDSLSPEDTARSEVAEPGIAEDSVITQSPAEETPHSDKDSVSSTSSLSSSTSSGSSTSGPLPQKQPKPQPSTSGEQLGFLLPDTETSSPSPREAAEYKENRHTLRPKGERSVSRTGSRSTSASAPVARNRKRRHQNSASADRRVTFRSPRSPGATPREDATMGSGVSRDGEMEEADPRFAAQSTAAMSHAGSPPRSPARNKQASMSQHSSLKSSGHMSMARQSRFNMEGLEDAEVRISSDGFNIQEVTIVEGQFVRFICDHSCPNNVSLLQVIHDGEELRPVIDGYQISLDERHGSFQQQLNLEGEYKFALTGIRCTPLNVRVRRKTDLPCEVTDEGFVPNTIYIEQGTCIRWSWRQTAVPHTVAEVNYVFDKGCFSRQSPNQSMVATTTGSHRQTFNRPGLFYLRTEGSEPGKTHLCIVCVHAVSREYRMEIMDRSFQPMILLIEEGDRVWFSWDRFKCKKAHSVYQIEPPGVDHNEDDAYEPARDGFKWTTPSKQGLMSHRFNKAGVFYFSDQNFEEAAEYIGTIIVKPKQREHVIKLEERGFVPDLTRVNTGERVWWLWDGPSIADVGEGLLLLEDDKVLNPLSKKNSSAEQSEHYQDLDASSTQLMTRVGAATIHFTTVGVYNYKVSDVGDHFSSCSILVNPGSKNHTVHLTDNGFEPKVITVNCNDRVWWVWQSGKRQHNIVQVSHQGLPIPGGFCSGMARDSPSAFTHQFSTAGVYYFISKTLPQVFGAVVVSTRPQVHEVAVKESELRPDPVTIQVNDVVAWIFGSPKQYDVTQVQSVDQVLNSGVPEKALTSRRCFARGINQTGYFHFKSRSFQRQKETNYYEDTRLSSVVCDDRCDSIITQLDKRGFHPDCVYLQKGQSLLWSWKGTDEEHNIIHVTDPQSAWKFVSQDKTPLNMIKGPRAFNSGRPLPNDSFLYTFDEAGSYTVVSQGAPGYSCTVNVLDVARRTGEPFICSEQKGGTVDRFSKVFLDSKTSHAKIYYTKDGSQPSTNSRTYHPDRGITLRQPGLQFVRAVAVSDNHLQSHIFTSRRFWVLSKGDGDGKSESSLSDQEMRVPPQTKSWDWWSCKPKIKGCFTSPGTLEVFWDPPSKAARKQIKSYQIYLNGVSYCQKFPSSTNSLKLVGLAGGRKYNVTVEIFPQHDKNQVQESNILQLTCPKVAPPGGPVISLETTTDPQTLSVVWMSIDTSEQPIDGYLVYLNDQQCGPKLVPETGSNRCKVVVSGCDTSIDYKLYVLAVSADGDETKMSNVLVVQLPLDTTNVTLPPVSERVADEEVYQEYIEVLEGSGYLPQMDSPRKKEITPRGRRVTASSSSGESETESETETESESDSETGSTVTETESDDSEQLPRARQLKQQDGLQQAAPLKKEVDVETTAPIQKRGPETTPRIGGLVDDDTTSDESESESDYESGAELPPGGHVVILDASKNQATDTKETLKSRAVGEKGHYRDHDDNVDMEVVGHSGKKGKKSGRPMALIQVQKTVALDMDERQVKESGDIMEKTKLAVSTEQKSMIQVKEGEYVTGDGDGLLPAPSIMATTKGKHSVRVGWELPREPDPQYKLLLYVVNVVGIKFSSEINSDISYECNLVEKGKQVRGVQHCWNIQDSKQCVINGLQPGLTYRIYVICNYSTMRGNKPCEIQTTSSVLYYTTLGPPKAPRLKIIRVDLYQTCIAWEAPAMHENARLSGYQIQVDGKPLGGMRNPEIQQMVINNLVPGKTISVNVVAVMARASQESAPSKTIHVTCPRRPACPTVSQQPSYKKGCVLLAWDKPRGHPDTTEESITAYSIFVDGQWHGEVKANRMGDQQGYQFFLTDLAPEQSYDVSVKAIAGDRSCDPDSQHVYCLSESFMSNVVPVMAPAAPKSPKLRLEGLHPDGVDVTWQVPQQSGDAHISGYQMLKNGKLYGSVIPPDVNSLRIRDISLGEKLNLQLIALTEHPVGKSDVRAGSAAGDKDSGISGFTTQHEDRSAVTSPASAKGSQKVVTFTRHVRYRDGMATNADVFAGERYTGCKPGPKLVIHYTGLVCPPSEVWCERVTGHSALIVWSKADERKAHYVPADSYQVTWWPGDRPQDEINSDSTTDDHLLITTLRPSTTYTVVVEARKTEKYTDMDEAVSPAETPEGLNAFILSSKSEHLTVKTASPPDPPRNVGVSATTCNSLNVAWDPPQEHGSEVIAIRIECISLHAQDPHHITEDIMPDSTSCDITGLHEKTDYLVRVIAVTEEYFDRLPDKHKHKKLHAIPRDVLVAQEESPWLPSASLVAKTAGTEAPANIRLSQSTMTSLELTWTPPLVYGSNRLLSQIVRWRDVRRTKPTDPEDLIVSSHVNLLPTEDSLKISDLVPGSQYQVVIEAVVSIKTSLNPDQSDSGIEKFRRTAHVMSKPLVVWTRAPIEPPKLLVQSYDQSSAVLYWEKPILMSIIGKDDEGNPRYLRRYLEGYRLEINGKLQSCLGPQAQTCTLTKCKPGKLYSVVLVAMTCTEDRRRERKEKFKGYFKTTAPQDTDYVGLLDDDLLDQAPSEPMEVTLPKSQDGFLETVKTNFVHQEERDNRTFGDVEVVWTTQGQSNLLKQFSIVWYSSEDRVIQTKYVGPEKRRAAIPVTHLKSIYTVTVEPCYYTDVLPQQPQDVHIMIPGPPDAPEIFLRSQDKDEFVIEWGEPRCYGGVKVKGYQVFMNDKKVGNELSNSHRKAIIPCRINKMYRINLVALSSNPDYQDSPKSNTLVINSGKESVQSSVANDEHTDDHDLPLKVTGVTECGIHLDWSGFLENQDVAFYKIQWSSVAQPAQREVRLSLKDISCVINKCLPGTTHFVRLLAYNEDGQIIEKSRQMTVQTSAPPDAPVLSVRACNFRYIAIQWEKPTTYGDALITGYKVYVNGIVEAVLSADSLSFTFTQGKWCQEFSFQVQALTAGDSLNSKPSEPLVLTWPGTSSPQIRRIPSVSSSSLRVAWNPPQLTEGVKVKHFKLCCVEEDTEKLVQSVGPIHPDSTEAEFKHLKKGGYTVFLETHLYGTGEVVRSDPIRMQPSVCPDPPQISVTIVGLEERRQVEKLTCDLANKRDRLIRSVGHKLKRIGALAHPLRAEKDDDVVLGAHTLTGVEELLESCFLALENHTGQLIAHVSWQCPQTNEDVHLSGFKVLVDGKQYGSSMHSGVRTVRLQLGLDQPSYTLSMVALSDKPQGSSVESAAVELLTSPFTPFSYYCYHNIHSKGAKWPSHGCCKYQDALTYERQVGRKLANQGLLLKHVPPPACSLLDIFGGDYKPLMSGHRPHCPTVLFFWTPWCLSSQKVMDFYVRFAREASKEFNFVAVSCGVSGLAADDRQTLVHQLTSGGWREDGVMWHCTSECATNVYRSISNVNQTISSLRVDKDLVSEKYMDLTELLGIAGVPTFLFIHPEGYISWHGRYSSYDFPAFSAFMRHTNSEVMRHPCPVFNCDCCKNDMAIDHELIASILPEKVRAAPQTVAFKTLSSPNNSESNMNSAAASRTDLKYAAINGFTDSASGTDRVFMARKPSPKRRNKLSINRRPYSASATPQQLQGSPYLAKVVPNASPSRSRNRPVSAKLHYV